MATGLVRPSSAGRRPTSAPVNRQVAVKLQADLQRSLGNANLSADDARAPRGESADSLAEALKAPMVRSGV